MPCLCGVGNQMIVVDVCTKDLENLYILIVKSCAPFGHLSLPSPWIDSRSNRKLMVTVLILKEQKCEHSFPEMKFWIVTSFGTHPEFGIMANIGS